MAKSDTGIVLWLSCLFIEGTHNFMKDKPNIIFIMPDQFRDA